MYVPATEKAYEVFFGGRYQEYWTEDYHLSVRYEGRRSVQAVRSDGRWKVGGGDALIKAELESPDCPSLTMQYFQAAAETAAAVERCQALGAHPERMREYARFGANPLAAPELMRRLMDDCDWPIDRAFQAAAVCCEDLRASGVDAEAVRPLQPRTAHLVGLLRGCSRDTLVARHDCSQVEYRSPVGAVPEGAEIRLALHIPAGHAEQAVLVLYGDVLREEYPMTREEEGFQYTLRAPEMAAALWYCFRLETDDGVCWLCPDESGYRGRLYDHEAPGYRLTVYRKEFETPAWFRRSVLYQIFPDRFAFSDDDTAARGIAYHQSLGQTPELHQSLTEPVRFQARPFEKEYSPDDFYGGTLKGIQEKLPYLKELGVTCLYLNPIVEARSNHRYDTANYLRVDPVLGSNEDFTRLCTEAQRVGIRILLDGVFSHTGADSVYFNRWGHYPDKGACQGQDSPYFNWFDFRSFPDDYRCWWGFRDLPEVNEENDDWQRFIIRDEDSVVRTWLRRGAAGWRLDVADELPDEVLALIRQAAKEEKPDALILGEVWEDAVIKESYGSRRRYALGDSLDTVMNYPLRTAVLRFMRGHTDAYALRDFLMSQQLNYPKPLYYSLMNLLGSHDVERLRTALASDVEIGELRREEQMHLYFSPEALDRATRLEMLCAVIQFALPGVPSIYYGDEQGMCGIRDPFNRTPFKEGNPRLKEYYAALANMRNCAAALATGNVSFQADGEDVLLILRYIRGRKDVFGLPAEDGAFLAVVNRGSTPADYMADCSEAGLGLVQGRIDACSAEIVVL